MLSTCRYKVSGGNGIQPTLTACPPRQYHSCYHVRREWRFTHSNRQDDAESGCVRKTVCMCGSGPPLSVWLYENKRMAKAKQASEEAKQKNMVNAVYYYLYLQYTRNFVSLSYIGVLRSILAVIVIHRRGHRHRHTHGGTHIRVLHAHTLTPFVLAFLDSVGVIFFVTASSLLEWSHPKCQPPAREDIGHIINAIQYTLYSCIS